MNFSIERLNSIIRRKLSDVIVNELDDPLVSNMTSINHIKLAKDLSIAHIHVGMPGTEDEIKANAKQLNKNARKLRSRLANGLNLRRTPELKFHADTLSLEADALFKLIDQARN